MPQMMPINWIFIFIIIIFIFILFNIMNYYTFIMKLNTKNSKKIMYKNFFWKW